MHHSEYDTRLAAYAVMVDAQDRVLLTWYNGSGRPKPGWSLPGGGIDYAETIEEGLRREVFEETGYHVEVGPILTADSFTGPPDGDDGRPFKGIRLLYAARICGGTLGTQEVGGSTDFARWIPVADVAALPERTAAVVTYACEQIAAGRVTPSLNAEPEGSFEG